MFIIIGIMLTGMALGFIFRNKQLKFIHKLITILVWILLFLLGTDVGSNDTIINGLHTIGTDALIITISAVLGSVTMAGCLWWYIEKRNRKEHL